MARKGWKAWTPEKLSLPERRPLPINFLLGNPVADIDNFRLMRMQAAADLREQLHAILDRIIDEMSQAAVAAWFAQSDREALKAALENEEGPLEWAKRMIRGGHEIIEHITLNPGQAQRTAEINYQKRNIAKGKCRSCPNPLAHGSVQYCEEHLAKSRVRQRQKKGLQNVGSREYLYAGDITEEQTHGRQPGTLASLALSRERKTRAILAELGIPPESAAVTLNAAKEALLRCMSARRGHALAQQELFDLAVIPSKTTGGKALNELLSDQKIERIGKGINGDPYRYFLRQES